MTRDDYLTKNIVEETRKVKVEYDRIIKNYSEDLWKYCRYITGSPWEGEDLYQDTLIKSFAILPQRWSEITDKKNYLLRIATNIWFDQCRKSSRIVGTLDETEEHNVEFKDSLVLEETLNYLASLLTPKQTAAFLLFDVFGFSAEEVAGIVHSTPGGVYSTLQRARQKIKSSELSNDTQKECKYIQNETIKVYLEAFNNGDLSGILKLFSEQAQNEAFLGFQEYSKDEMITGSLRFGLPNHYAEQRILWGKPVIIVLSTGETGPEIHDIQIQEVENGKIVFHKSYFFRKEFIFAASKELGFKPQLIKPPVNWN